MYGDAQGVVITYNNKETTCSFEDIKNDPSVCYYVKDQCCQQCRHFYTGIAGIEQTYDFPPNFNANNNSCHFELKLVLHPKVIVFFVSLNAIDAKYLANLNVIMQCI